MKKVLRMSLFIIARAGLFLAVVAWIVSRWWWGGSLVYQFQSRAIGVTCHEGTWTANHYKFVLQGLQDRNYFFFRLPLESGEPINTTWRVISHPFPGVVVHLSSSDDGMSLHHWLITSLFTAFNIALHFIYRKRPEDKPCEV